MVEPIQLNAFVNRLKLLEDKMYNQENESDASVKVSASLQALNSQMDSAMSGRIKMKNVLKKVKEIDQCLNPVLSECIVLKDTTKMDLILASEVSLCKSNALLESILDLKQVFDSHHIKTTPLIEEKLVHLSQVRLEQHFKMTLSSEKVKSMLHLYNNVENLVLVDLSGIIDNGFLQICGSKCKILNVEAQHPLLQLGHYVFKGEYESIAGTAVLLEVKTKSMQTSNGNCLQANSELDDGPDQLLKVSNLTRKKLNMTRVFLSENNPPHCESTTKHDPRK